MRTLTPVTGLARVAVATALALAPSIARAQRAFVIPDWVFPAPRAGAAAPATIDTAPWRVPNGARAFTRAQVNDRFAAVDWHPSTHGPMPEIVVRGRKPSVIACAFCHLPDGAGRPENAMLAGLSAAYIEQQLADMKSGARRSAHSTYVPGVLMNQIADSATEAEVRAAATYFSGLRAAARSRVLERDTIPRVRPGVGLYFREPRGGTEPLGVRLIDMATDQTRHELRDAAATYVSYVPRGSIARGRRLSTAAPGGAQACVACHGERLRGGAAPPLAGRAPSSLLRQLVAFRAGTRSGPAAAPMQAVVAGMPIEDMIAVAAYAGSLRP